MYSKGGCGYCEMASKWFEEHAVRYTEVKMDDEENRLAFYQKINGTQESIGDPTGVRRVNSMPQIMIDDKHIGGYDELMVCWGYDFKETFGWASEVIKNV